MNKSHIPARAPNKRSLLKMGAVLVAAMLGIGAFSLVDTASAEGDGLEWTRVDGVTETTEEYIEPALPEGYENPVKWVGEGTVPGDPVRVGVDLHNMQGNPRLAPGQESPAPDHPDWSRPLPGALPAHARDKVDGLPTDGSFVIYNVSQGNSGNASWFKIRGEFEFPEVYLWQLYEGTPVVEEIPELEEDAEFKQEYRVDRFGNLVLATLQPTYLVRVPYIGGGSPEVPGGAVGTDEFTPEVWNWNRAIDAIRDNSPDVGVPDGAVQGVPFEQAGNGGGNSSYFLFVTVDGDAYRAANDGVLRIELPGGGQVQLARQQGTWVVVSGS